MLLSLSASEASHLLTLLYERDESGDYYGNREQYAERTRALIVKIKALLAERTP